MRTFAIEYETSTGDVCSVTVQSPKLSYALADVRRDHDVQRWISWRCKNAVPQMRRADASQKHRANCRQSNPPQATMRKVRRDSEDS